MVAVSTHPSNVQRTSRKVTEDDLSTWLSRDQALDLLNVTFNTILALERRDQLHPKKMLRPDRSGAMRMQWVYDPRELAKVPQRHRGFGKEMRPPGEAAARAFELFREGHSLEEVVVELREAPDHVRELHERWLDMGGSRMVITPSAREALEKIVGAFASVSELVERVAKIATDAAGTTRVA